MIRIAMQFFGDNGGSGAGGTSASNNELNLGIASSDDWINRLQPQGGNTETADGGLTKAKRIETIMKQLHCSRSMAEKYAAAIEEYGENAEKIRSAQHSRNTSSDAYKSGKDLEEYIKNANRWAGGTTYHAITSDPEAFNATNSEGTVLSLGGTSTWYSTAGKAKQHAKVMLVSPTQSKGTGINRVSIHSGEKEVIASEASRYKIKKKYWEGKTLYVQVEEV